MTGAVIAGRKPRLVKFEKAGERVFWCACGRSASQPFCDGSHKGTGFAPIRIITRRAGEEALLCVCKRTGTPPYCDGSHNALADEYETASRDEIAASSSVRLAARSDGDYGRADLDGGCFVLTPPPRGGEENNGWRVTSTISRAEGSDRLSQFILTPLGADPDPISFGEAETILFIAGGEAAIKIGDAQFMAPANSVVTVRPGEAFAAHAATKAQPIIIATVCPETVPAFDGRGDFDRRFPERLGRIDPQARRAMGDRFYQVLTRPESGAENVTQFIGEIPRSRAAAHRHLYEEALYVLSGEGVMWTQTRKAAVKTGDVIYLPRKQLHSLECLSSSGMMLAGSFYPAGSPAINY